MSNKNDAFAGLVSFGGSTSSSSATQNMSLEEQRRRNLNNSRSNTLNSTPSSFSTAPSYHTANPTLPSQQFNLPTNRAQSLSPSGVGTGSPLLPMHSQPRANYTAASSMSPAFSTASNVVKPTSHSPSKDPFADLLGTSPLANVQLPLNAINSTQSSGFNTPITMNQYNRSTSSSSTPIMAPQTLNAAFAIQSGFNSAFQSPQNGLVNGFMPQQQQQQQQLPLSLLQQQQQQQQTKQSVYQQPQTQEVNNDIWNFDALASATSASKTSNITSADPFGLGFSDSSSKQTNPIPLPTEVGSFQQAEDDDPFGILTGKPTFKPLKPTNVLDTPLQSAPQSPPQPLSLHASPISRASAAASSNGSPSITRKQRQHDEQIARILDMGFDIPSATSALEASGGDVHEAINLLIANREALEGQQHRSSTLQNERQQYSIQSSRASSRDYERRTRQAEDNFASNPPTAAALFSNAKSIFDMGRAKLTEVYEKASEKVAAVIAENVDGNKQQAQNNPASWDQDYSNDRTSSQRNRYRDDSSSDEDEVALDRKSRSSHRANPSTNGGLEAASPRGKSPRTSALRLNSREPSENGRLKQVSFGMDPNAQSNLFESHKSSPVFVPATIVVPQPVHTASPAQKAAANSFRERGNESFKKGQFADAEAHYTTALSHMPAEDWDSIALLNNRAAARLKTGDYSGCVQDCNAVQALQPKDVKSLLRRAAAWEGREKWDEATKDYETLMVLEPTKAVSLGLARARKGAVVHSGGDAAFVANEISGAASVSTKSAIDDLAFLSGNVADTGSFNSFNRASSSTVPPKPMAASVKKAVDKAVETLRQQNEDQEREEEEKFQAKEGIEAKIDAWKQGKEANIRALLSSLDSVLWSDLNWNTINLSELITPQQVKIKYMKAVAKVHPDKLKQGTTVEQKLIANEVFGALNKAWDAFKVQSGL